MFFAEIPSANFWFGGISAMIYPGSFGFSISRGRLIQPLQDVIKICNDTSSTFSRITKLQSHLKSLRKSSDFATPEYTFIQRLLDTSEDPSLFLSERLSIVENLSTEFIKKAE